MKRLGDKVADPSLVSAALCGGLCLGADHQHGHVIQLLLLADVL